MAKKPSKTNTAPMPWRDFVIGFQIATSALEDPDRVSLPEVDPAEADDDKARAARRALRRDPFLRVLVAVQGHFGRRYKYLGSFTYRFWALIHLMRRGHVDRWLTRGEDSDSRRFHPAVLLAAADVKLTKSARFPVDRFLARVEEIIATEGPDADRPDAAAG